MKIPRMYRSPDLPFDILSATLAALRDTNAVLSPDGLLRMEVKVG